MGKIARNIFSRTAGKKLFDYVIAPATIGTLLSASVSAGTYSWSWLSAKFSAQSAATALVDSRVSVEHETNMRQEGDLKAQNATLGAINDSLRSLHEDMGQGFRSLENRINAITPRASASTPVRAENFMASSPSPYPSR